MISRAFPDKSIFLARYLIGSAVGWAFIIAMLLAALCERMGMPKPIILNCIGLVAAWLAVKSITGSGALGLVGKIKPDVNAYMDGRTDQAFGHAALPIVCARGLRYLPRRHYSPESARYFFLLDKPATTAPGALLDECVTYNLFSALKQNSSDAGNLVEATEFLAKNPVFLVHDIPERNWCKLHLKAGQYTVTRLEPDRQLDYSHGEWPMLLVEKRP